MINLFTFILRNQLLLLIEPILNIRIDQLRQPGNFVRRMDICRKKKFVEVTFTYLCLDKQLHNALKLFY